jgi:HSP20 family protein
MPSRNSIGWMWADACQMLERAERLQRQFFRLDFPRGARVAWEPPVDVFEDEHEFVVVVALPGVTPGNADAAIEGRTLLIRARRRVPMAEHQCTIERMEIPYGYFERRLTLPPMPLELGAQQLSDGCLVLSVRKV